MRVGDFSVDVVPTEGPVREVDSGHVLARPGQVYTLRLRNHGPLRAVVDITIDGRRVTGGGLVLDAWSVEHLERPIHETERGRFTVIAEGNEQVFGPDGGRDNPNLGLIEARFRRELPRREAHEHVRQPGFPPGIPRPIVTMPLPPAPATRPEEPWPRAPRRTPIWESMAGRLDAIAGREPPNKGISALLGASPVPVTEPAAPAQPAAPVCGDAIERAAGTGLTGSSSQEFVPVHVGQLESEATVIRLRLVIATDEALSAPRPLPESDVAPARPAARP